MGWPAGKSSCLGPAVFSLFSDLRTKTRRSKLCSKSCDVGVGSVEFPFSHLFFIFGFVKIFFLMIYLFIYFVFLPILGLLPRHMEFPRLGVESEL